MLRFIDISNWQSGLDLRSMDIDAVVVKATEGNWFVDPSCDGWVQQAIDMDMPWGFYHFANVSDPIEEADYFISNCDNYFGHGIPILDWEGNPYGSGDQSVDWVNQFVNRVHSKTGVWPWIYGNPWRFNQGGVEPNCMRWVASYPDVVSPSFSDAEGWEAPYADGLVGAWQFCSDGRVSGYDGNLDCDLFYGDKDMWAAYTCKPVEDDPIIEDMPVENPVDETDSSNTIYEDDRIKVIIEKKGR